MVSGTTLMQSKNSFDSLETEKFMMSNSQPPLQSNCETYVPKPLSSSVSSNKNFLPQPYYCHLTENCVWLTKCEDLIRVISRYPLDDPTISTDCISYLEAIKHTPVLVSKDQATITDIETLVQTLRTVRDSYYFSAYSYILKRVDLYFVPKTGKKISQIYDEVSQNLRQYSLDKLDLHARCAMEFQGCVSTISTEIMLPQYRYYSQNPLYPQQ